MAHQRGLLSASAADPAAMPSTKASDYVSNPLSKLPISRASFQGLRSAAVAIANEVEEKELCPENMPPSLAAGVLALLLKQPGVLEEGEELSYEQIAGVCGVSEGTLQKCLKKLEAAVKAGQIRSVTF